MSDSDRRTLTVEEAARVLGIGRSLAYELVSRGELPSVRLGRRIVVPVAALDELLRQPRRPEPVPARRAALPINVAAWVSARQLCPSRAPSRIATASSRVTLLSRAGDPRRRWRGATRDAPGGGSPAWCGCRGARRGPQPSRGRRAGRRRATRRSGGARRSSSPIRGRHARTAAEAAAEVAHAHRRPVPRGEHEALGVKETEHRISSRWRCSAATRSGCRPIRRRPFSVFGATCPAYRLLTSSTRSHTSMLGSSESISTWHHRSPAISPGRKPHMSAVNHIAGHAASGMASTRSRRTWSTVRLDEHTLGVLPAATHRSPGSSSRAAGGRRSNRPG